ncbi:MAG: hypothetical protein PF541_16275, partial [Prolixibacteraceae bacterium]|nr:hypothetical protein [Prolixibacteraceae bacterium]
MLTSTDLNNAFLSYILTGYEPFISAAGYVGPKYKVDHDVSLLMPEVISRMSVAEQDPKFLIENGYFEKVNDFEFEGEVIKASLLGYRITLKFVHHFLGRIFSNPDAVFTEDMLRPELQDLKTYADSIKNLSVTQVRVAEGLMKDGTYEALCPQLKAIVSIMINGEYKGMDREHPEIRKMFTREYVIESDWYKERLLNKQQKEILFWRNNISYIENLLTKENFNETAERLNFKA